MNYPYRGLDEHLLHLLGDSQGELWRLFLLQKHSQRSSKTFETEQVVTVGRDFNLELGRRRRQSLGFGSLDFFGGLGSARVRGALRGAHVFVELDAKVEA